MAQHPLWNDDYWLLLIQLYLQKPVGVKPLYSRALVAVSLELHIEPQYLYRQLFRLHSLDTPRLQRLWDQYSKSPARLHRAIGLLRRMKGFNHAEAFYEGVDVDVPFEKLFQPLPGDARLTPLMLVIILDLYFRLTPITMVTDTPEIRSLAKKMSVDAQLVVDVMDVYLHCDPCINRRYPFRSELLPDCQAVWQHYSNGDPAILSAQAAQYKEYFN